MTILAALDKTATDRSGAGEFLKLARLLTQHGNAHDALNSAEGQRAADRVRTHLKSVVAPMSTTSASALVSLNQMAQGFASTLVGYGSVFDTVKAGAKVVPLNTRIAMISGGATATTVAELSIKPASSLTLTSTDMQMAKCVCHVTITKEQSLFSTPDAEALFNDELRRAIVRQVDREFLAQLVGATAPTASAGASAANILADLNAMYALVDVQPTSQVYWVMSVPQALTYSQVFTTGGLLFPELGPRGGPALSGIQILTSNETPANRSLLIVADGLAVADEPIEMRHSEHGSIYLDTAPDSPSISTSVLTSLWQADLVGLLAERRFAVRPRARSVASISY